MLLSGARCKARRVYAIKLYKELASKKHAFANYMLGDIYRIGQYVEQDYVKAVNYYKQAVKLNNPYAIQHLALMYEHGMGVDVDLEQAIKLYEKGAKLNNTSSMYNLAVRYIETKNKPQEAIKLLEKEFSLGDDEAMCYLAQMYHEGSGGVEVDNEKALQCYEKAAQKGNGKACYNVGLIILNGESVEKNITKAIEYFEKSAKLGIPEAYYTLGQLYFAGEVVEKDIEKTLKYYQIAAKAGSVDANYNLGVMYHKGLQVQVDHKKAVQYYTKAIDLGCVDSLNNLGTMYAMGEGVEQDAKMAEKYYSMAAERGNVGAMFNAAEILFELGFEETETVKKAIKLYEDFLEEKKGASNDLYVYYAYIRLVQCCFDLHCYQESNEKNRDIYYYKRTKELKNKAKQYSRLAKEYRENNKDINVDHEIQLVLDVYTEVINDDDLDLNALEYAEFKTKFYNKHDNLFLLTRNSQKSVFESGIKAYFDKKSKAETLFNDEMNEQKERFSQRKAKIVQYLTNLNIANVDEEISKIESSVEEDVKQKYVEDYSVCVVNLDKHMEEILHFIFVESFYDYSKKSLNETIKNGVKEVSQMSAELDNDFLGKIKEVIVGRTLPDSAKNSKENNIKTVEKLMFKFTAKNNLDADVLEKCANLMQFGLDNELNEKEQEWLDLVLKTKENRLELENLTYSEKFELGNLFHLTFIDMTNEDGVSAVSQKVMNSKVIEFVQSLNPNKPYFDVKVKLRELLLKVEMFRVSTRNVASHKSILTKAMAEKGINLCVAQKNSIFDLMDELFGEYINQKYIEELLKKANVKVDEPVEEIKEDEKALTN